MVYCVEFFVISLRWSSCNLTTSFYTICRIIYVFLMPSFTFLRSWTEISFILHFLAVSDAHKEILHFLKNYMRLWNKYHTVYPTYQSVKEQAHTCFCYLILLLEFRYDYFTTWSMAVQNWKVLGWYPSLTSSVPIFLWGIGNNASLVRISWYLCSHQITLVCASVSQDFTCVRSFTFPLNSRFVSKFCLNTSVINCVLFTKG